MARIDVVVAATDLPPAGCAALLRRLKEDPKLKRIPVLGASAGAATANGKLVEGFDDCQVKENSSGILASVRRLAEALDRTDNVAVEA